MPTRERFFTLIVSGIALASIFRGGPAFAYELSSPAAPYNETPKKRADVYVEGDHAFSKNYTASAYDLGAILPVWKRDPLLIEAHKLTRTFKAGNSITDSGGMIGYIWTGNRYYIENSVAINPNALFLPRTSITVVPHWVTGFWGHGWDFSLGLIGSRYGVLDAFTVNPRVLCDSDSFYYAASFFATRTYHELYSTDLVLGLHLPKRQKAQIDYSFGRTIEDRGVEDSFNAVGGLYQFRVWRNWYLGPAVQLYRGNARTEDNYALRIDLKL